MHGHIASQYCDRFQGAIIGQKLFDKLYSLIALTTLISGESTGIAAGLYSQFAIAQIKPSLLTKYLSSEAIAAILGSLSAFTILALEKIIFKDAP